MHLTLRLPHIWYRAAFELESAGAPMRRLVGVTLPGTPALVAGSNGQVAWGLTNSYGAYLDLLELELDPKDASRYRLPPTMRGTSGDEWGLVRTVEERIAVAGGADEVLAVEGDRVRPGLGTRRPALRGALGRARSGRHQLRAVRARARGEHARSDRHRQARRLSGAEPGRGRCRRPHRLDRRRRLARARGELGLDLSGAGEHGRVAHLERARRAGGASEHRRPGGGQIVTANARQLAGAGYAAIGDGGADLGARQRQLRDSVTELGPSIDEAGMYGVFLDDRALYLAPWRDRALQALAGDTDPARAPSATSSSACSRPPGPAGRASIRSATG